MSHLIVTPIPRGLKNFGNTCFLNSVIQCLAHLEILFFEIMKRNIARKSFVSSKKCITCIMEKCIRSIRLWDSSAEKIDYFVKRLLDSLDDFPIKGFKHGKQEDAHEFFIAVLLAFHGSFQILAPTTTPVPSAIKSMDNNKPLPMSASSSKHSLLDGLAVDSSSTKLPPFKLNSNKDVPENDQSQPTMSVPSTDTLGTSATLPATNHIPTYNLNASNLLAQSKCSVHSNLYFLFEGSVLQQIYCFNCKEISKVIDPIIDLSIDVKKTSSLQKGLKEYFKTEMLNGTNKYFCSKCQATYDAQKCVRFQSIPKILSIQLKRFDVDPKDAIPKKLNHFVEFPLSLDISSHITAENAMKLGSSTVYDLSSFIVHAGDDPESGHYISYVRHRNNKWYRLDDSIVKEVDKKEVLSSRAYLLYYEQRDYVMKNLIMSTSNMNLSESIDTFDTSEKHTLLCDEDDMSRLQDTLDPDDHLGQNGYILPDKHAKDNDLTQAEMSTEQSSSKKRHFSHILWPKSGNLLKRMRSRYILPITNGIQSITKIPSAIMWTLMPKKIAQSPIVIDERTKATIDSQSHRVLPVPEQPHFPASAQHNSHAGNASRYSNISTVRWPTASVHQSHKNASQRVHSHMHSQSMK